MTSISFGINQKRDIMDAHVLWARKLPRLPGQIGGPFTTWVEGPPMGNMVNFIVHPDFVAYLRAKDIPFVEV